MYVNPSTLKLSKFIKDINKMKKYHNKYLYKLFLIFLILGLIVTFFNLLNVENYYITIVSISYICMSVFLVFFTKIGDLDLFKNKYFEKYYENHIISGNLLIFGIIFSSLYMKNIPQVSLMGVIFILIGLIGPYFSRKNWDD